MDRPHTRVLEYHNHFGHPRIDLVKMTKRSRKL
jgi:hypothetical protein